VSLWERFSAIWPRNRNVSLNQNQTRLILTLGGLAVIGISLLLISSLFTGSRVSQPPVPKETPKVDAKGANSAYPSIVETETMIESRLEEVLHQVVGVGSVTVRVTLAAGPDYQYTMNHSTAKKTVEEKDRVGGSRLTTEVNDDGQLVLVHLSQYGGEQPVIERELRPEVDGVLVVAEGAGNALIREQLTRAVETVLHVPAYKVSVLPKEGVE